MTGTVQELIVIVLKLVYTIVTSIISWNVEERNRFQERMKVISKLLKDAVDNKDESLNEEDYLSNLEWEKQERYKVYKQHSLAILNQGGGISDFYNISELGMGLRVKDKKEIIVTILLRNLNIEEKSQWIAKELVGA